ncbi:MAG: DJ-1/PfpI family protein [Clostridiales bacterium]|nr:DJ-1/PfpI family protein [Clostridiales bacterium]
MIYVFLTNGTEEIEALATVDFLRRCDIAVKTVGISDQFVCGSHNINIACDASARQISVEDNVDGIVIPGGMPGTLNLEKSKIVSDFIDYSAKNDKIIAAICAAPSILGHKGLLKGKKATCFPGFEKELEGATVLTDRAVVDGNIITGKGMGAAIEFAHAIATKLVGKEKADKVKESLQ